MIRFQSSCGHYRQLQQILLEYLFHIAFADGELHAAERSSLEKIGAWLGISGAGFAQLLQMYHAQYGFAGGGAPVGRNAADQLSDAYTALGVDASASDREIKRAYRKLMSQHHPDKLIAQGVPEDMLKVATEKSQEISAAYDLILKARGGV
jgi:DnaJ like chaperone protein